MEKTLGTSEITRLRAPQSAVRSATPPLVINNLSNAEGVVASLRRPPFSW
jgi:hypothetical protein